MNTAATGAKQNIFHDSDDDQDENVGQKVAQINSANNNRQSLLDTSSDDSIDD